MNERRLGKLGERFVASVFNGRLSEDWFDPEKDLILEDGTTVEVKTQVRYRKKNAFTVYQTPTNNNLRKCLTVDKLLFVEPCYYGVIRIYELPKGKRFFETEVVNGHERYLFPIENMNLIYEEFNEELYNEMVSLTKSDLQYMININHE